MTRKSINFVDATGAWLRSRTLSASTLSCYRGEINRLAEYAADSGIDRLAMLDGDTWRRYIRSLSVERSPRITRRRTRLKSTSQIQALRITNAFLIWAWESQHIAWRPSTDDLRELPAEAAKEISTVPDDLPPALLSALAGKVAAPSMEACRGLLAVNLSYWGSLSPRELVQLKQSSIGTQQDRTTSRITLGASKLLVPTHVERLWARYLELRRTEFGKLLHTGLFSSLERDERASAWTLWSSIRNYQLDHLGLEDALPGHRLRSHYVRRALKNLSPPYAALLDHADLRYLRLESPKHQGHPPSNATPAYGRFVKKLRAELAAST